MKKIVVGLALLLIVSCTATKKLVCPTDIIRVVETEHSYVVVYSSGCVEHTRELAK